MERVPQVQSFITLILTPKLRGSLGIIVAGFLLAGCSTTFATRQVTYREVMIEQPKMEIAESNLLGVRIKPFEPGEVPQKGSSSLGISKEVRTAEGYYAAIQLKTSMQQSGYWGPVRCIPGEVTGGEVIITGRILESDGEMLKLEVSVHDATGALWFTNEYSEVVNAEAYKRSQNGVETFQFLYNKIANDVARFRAKMAPQTIKQILQIAELKFANEFAPEAFEGYLEKGESEKEGSSLLSKWFSPTQKGQTVKIAKLPADDDPMLMRVRRIRSREETFIDTLDLQYEGSSRKISGAYTQWRIARLNEVNAVRKLDEKRNEKIARAVGIGLAGLAVGILVGSAGGRDCYACASAGGSVAGAAAGAAVTLAIQATKQAEEEAEIHKVALQELGESLAEDLKVTTVQLEGETVELKGSAEAKFNQWRGILKKIYDREVGARQPADATSIGPASINPAESKERGAKGERP